MTIQPTPNQQKAIDIDGCNLLVSASAGSGKTAVLVQRILRILTDPHERVSLDHLLIVTFTKAAAKDMKAKLQKELTQRIDSIHLDAADNLQQRQLRSQQDWLIQQLRLLNVADITTTDAFCMQLVRRYFYVIDLDPSFRMMDNNEQILLKQQVWENVREELFTQAYQHANNDFIQLTRNFSNDRNDDGLYNVIQKILSYADVHPQPEEWLRQLVKPYEVGEQLMASDIYQQLLPILQANLQDIANNLQLAHKLLMTVDATATWVQKYQVVFDQVQQQLDNLRAQLTTGTWDDLRQIINNLYISTPRDSKKVDKTITAQLKIVIANIKDTYKTLQTYFILPEKILLNVSQDAAKLVNELVTVVIKYRQQLNNVKRQRNMVTFNDIEHFAYQILHSDKYPQVIKDIQSQYREIMIDEYQDTNELQEAILQSISNPKYGNRFMVGDMKQSIYGFRQANPKLFQDKLNTYQTQLNALAQQPDNGIKINLDDNFRSVAGIDAFVNMIFSQIMDQQLGGSDYLHDGMLRFGAKYYDKRQHDSTYPATEIMLYDPHQNSEQNTSAMFDSKEEAAAIIVARKIKQLVNHDQIYVDGKWQSLTYGDIMILARNRHYNLALTDVFEQMHIPIHVNDVENYFQTTEIQIMLALLQIIDNPDQDIPLVAVLRSPMFALGENNLAKIRIHQRQGSYYQAVQAFISDKATDSDLRSNLTNFMTVLNDLRDFASHESLSTLIWHIYQVTGWLDYVGGMPNGQQRQANLHALYDRAQIYEDNGFQGLFQFVQFIKQLQQENRDLSEAVAYQEDDAVQVTTIHGSKGLQAPVVILMGLEHKFNQEDLNANTLIDENGLGIKYLTPSHLLLNTLQYEVQHERMKKELAAEEMRLLYVALTRAEQKLILVGELGKTYSQILSKWQQDTDGCITSLLPLSSRLKANNYLKWIGMSLVREVNFADHREGHLLNDQANFDVAILMPTTLQTDEQQSNIWQAYPRGNNVAQLYVLSAQLYALSAHNEPFADQATLLKLLNGKYANIQATMTTAYQAVSKAKQYFDDPDNQSMHVMLPDHPIAYSAQDNNKFHFDDDEFATPRFIDVNEKQPSPSAIGTATHLLLQKINLEQQPTHATLAQLLTDCEAMGIITPNVALYVNLDHILRLFNNQLGQLLLQYPKHVHREQPFAMIMPATKLFSHLNTNEQSAILIHGIIDGYLCLPNNEVILFDYKTDRITNEKSLQNALSHYRGQLALYADALMTIIPNANIIHRYLYFLDIDELIDLNHQ